MLRVFDLRQEGIQEGLRIKSLISNRTAAVVEVDERDDCYAWILWEGDDKPYSGFYGTNCKCEVVESFPVTDPHLDVPDGEKLGPYRRVGEMWELERS